MNKNHFFELYADFLRGFLKLKKPVKVVFDCSNGTTGLVLKKLFLISLCHSRESGNPENIDPSSKAGMTGAYHKIESVLINDNPDGNFPAHGPDPLAEGAKNQLKKEVRKQKADLGVIFDADGDRVFFIDNHGGAVSSDEVAYALMKNFKPPYPVNVNASWLIKKIKGTFAARTGHYFFKKIMKEKKSVFGAEFSGHFYFKDFFYCDSGIFAAIQMINFVSKLISGHQMSRNIVIPAGDLAKRDNIRTFDVQKLKTDLATWRGKLPKYYHSGEINLKVADKIAAMGRLEEKYGNKAKMISKLDGIWMEFTDWWFNARPSNTEDILRLSVEAMSKKVMNKKLKEIKKIIFGSSTSEY